MKTGPLAPISGKALEALGQIAEILLEVPNDEIEFVLNSAKEVAERMQKRESHRKGPFE